MGEWYLSRNGMQLGPYTKEQLEELAREGGLKSEDLLWSEEVGRWAPVGEILSLPLHPAYEQRLSSRLIPDAFHPGQPRAKKSMLIPILLGVLGLAVFATIIIGSVVIPLDSSDVVSGRPKMDALLSRGITDDSGPLEAQNSFSMDDNEIFVSVAFANMPEGSEITADWYYLEDYEEMLLVRYDREVSAGDSQVHFSINRPPFGWFEGNYQVILVLDEDQVTILPFTVGD